MAEKFFKDDTILARNEEDFLCTEVDGETVIMNAETGQYFGFNTVSTDIWNHLEKSSSFSDLIEKLLSEYDVERKVCEDETRPVLAKMVKWKIISKEK